MIANSPGPTMAQRTVGLHRSLREHADSETVFFVDDDEATLYLAAAHLRAGGFAVETLRSGRALLECMPEDAAGCLVIDLMPPGTSGLELLAALRRAGCRLPVVFVSAHGDARTATAAMKAGAVDFLCKPLVAEELRAAVRVALERNRRERAKQRARAELERRLGMLTPREREVCQLVARGLRNKQIAAELGTAEKTIKTHRGRVMAKLGMESMVELALMLSRLDEDGAGAGAADGEDDPSDEPVAWATRARTR